MNELPSLSGRQIGSYRIFEVVGRGGMGEVYRALDTKLDRPAAVKVLRGDRVSDPRIRRRFLDELRLSSRIVHPYVATVFDVIDTVDPPLLVMEYVDGRPLDVLLREAVPDRGRVLAWAIEIAEGLRALHESGYVHRDLKPGNVMITRDDHVKVMDFGLAGRNPIDSRSAPAGPHSTQTAPGTPMGTIAYMSPEQLRCERPDHRSDLFAFGIVLFELLTGVHPFLRASAAETISAILESPPGGTDGARLVSGAGKLGTIALRLLEKDRARRHPSVDALLADLRGAQRRSLDRPAPRSGRWVVAGAVIAALAAAAWLGALRQRAAPEGLSLRPAVAVLPFQEPMGAADGAGDHGPMLASLIGANLSQSQGVRWIGLERVLAVLGADGAGPPAGSAVGRIARSAPGTWVLAGKLYREGPDWVVAVEVYEGESSSVATAFTARGARLSDLAREIAVRTEARIAGTRAAPLASVAFAEDVPDEAYRLLQRAQDKLREQRYAEALEFLDRAVATAPDFVAALREQAELLAHVGYERRAREVISRARQLVDASDSDGAGRLALQVAATDARLHNRTVEAVAAARRLAELYPDEPEILARLAEMLAEGSKSEEALGFIDRGLEIDHLDPSLYVRKARVLGELGRADDALQALAEARRLFAFLAVPEPGSLEETRGNVLFRARRFDEAAQAYSSAVEKYRRDGLDVRAMSPLKSQGDMDLVAWRLDEAAARYREALPIAREAGHYSLVIRVLTSMGAELYRRRELEESEALLREAIDESIKLENDALRLAPMINLANVLNLKHETPEAQRWANSALELANQRADDNRADSARLCLAESARREGRLAEALTLLESLSRCPESGARNLDLCLSAGQYSTVAALDAERFAAAIEAAGRAVRWSRELGDDRRTAFTLLLRAQVFARLGRTADGRADLAEAARLMKSNTVYPKLDQTRQLAKARLDAADGRWGDVAAVAPVDLDGGTAEAAPLALLRAEALLHAGEAREADDLAVRTYEHPRTPVPSRLEASLLAARCRQRLGQHATSAAAARVALDEGERIGMPLTAWSAAELLLGAVPPMADATALRARSRALSKIALDFIPSDRVEFVLKSSSLDLSRGPDTPSR